MGQKLGRASQGGLSWMPLLSPSLDSWLCRDIPGLLSFIISHLQPRALYLFRPGMSWLKTAGGRSDEQFPSVCSLKEEQAAMGKGNGRAGGLGVLGGPGSAPAQLQSRAGDQRRPPSVRVEEPA